MGIRGHVQIKQPEYGKCCFTSWGSQKAWDYLMEKGLDIHTDGNDADADRWEIEIPSIDRLRKIVAELRGNHDVLGDMGDYAEDLADFLEEGTDAAEKNEYQYIIIEWF